MNPLQPNSLYRATRFANFERIFGFPAPSIIWVGAGLMQITTQLARPGSQAKSKLRMTLECSRTAKEIAMVSGIFVLRRSQTSLYNLASGVDIRKKDQKNRRIKLVESCPKQDDHKGETLKHRNKQTGSKSTDHKSQTRTFGTRSRKHLFSEMIEGTEKLLIPSKF